MVKMKVTTQGEEVINLLWDVIAAKGFEKDPFFEIASHEIRMLPKLEGTVHVNMALVVKFMQNYFFNPKGFAKVPRRNDASNDDGLFNQGPTKGLGKVQFHDCKIAYQSVNLPNVEVFKDQIAAFTEFLIQATPDKNQNRDIDYLLTLGEIFTLVAYGQLILESKEFFDVENDLMDEIFDFMVRDFSKYALQVFCKPSSTSRQKDLCRKMMKSPVPDEDKFGRIWKNHVYPLTGQYTMNP
jgi:acyl-CoA dehydrogenase